MKYSVIIFFLFAIALSAYSQSDFGDTIADCNLKFSEECDIGLRQRRSINCLLGKELPDFKGTSIKGEEIELKQYRGSIVVINLWFRNCAPCMAEMPGLNKLYDNYKAKGVEFISLTTDSEAVVKDMLTRASNQFKFEIIPNAKEIIFHDLHFTFGYPTTIIIDQNGIIRHIEIGGAANEKTADSIFNKLSTQLQMCL